MIYKSWVCLLPFEKLVKIDTLTESVEGNLICAVVPKNPIMAYVTPDKESNTIF